MCEITDVTQPILPLHFANSRGERMIAEYVQNPVREVSPLGMSAKYCGRKARFHAALPKGRFQTK